jgi:periplasmic protein CpxP/Spy
MKINGEKMKKVIIAIIAVAVLALGTMFAIAQKADRKDGHGFGKRGHHGRGGGGGMMLRGLDLTDAQKAQVKEIMEASRAKVQPIRESMKANRQKLNETTANGAFNETQVQSLATEQANLSAQLLVERTRVKSQIFALLTPEQKAKAAELKSQMKERSKGKGRHFRNRDKSTTETEKSE